MTSKWNTLTLLPMTLIFAFQLRCSQASDGGAEGVAGSGDDNGSHAGVDASGAATAGAAGNEGTDAMTDAGLDTSAGSDIDVGVDAGAGSDVALDSATGADSDASANAGTDTDAGPDADAGTDTGAGTDIDADTDTDAGTDANAGLDGDADSDSGSDAAATDPGAAEFAVAHKLASDEDPAAPGTIGIVTWSVDVDTIDSASIEFGLDDGYGMVAPVDLAEADYRTLLLGMKPDRLAVVPAGRADRCHEQRQPKTRYVRRSLHWCPPNSIGAHTPLLPGASATAIPRSPQPVSWAATCVNGPTTSDDRGWAATSILHVPWSLRRRRTAFVYSAAWQPERREPR